MTEVSEEAAGAGARDRVPELVALGAFVGVLLAGAGLALIGFQLPEAVQNVAPWVVLLAIGGYVRWSVPSSRLTPERRRRRDERRSGGIVGFLSGCTVLGGIAAASYLTSWDQWLVLGSFFAVTIGVGFLLHVRFTIGP